MGTPSTPPHAMPPGPGDADALAWEMRDHVAAMTPRGAALALNHVRGLPADERNMAVLAGLVTAIYGRAEQHAPGQEDYRRFRRLLATANQLLNRWQTMFFHRNRRAPRVVFGDPTPLLYHQQILDLLGTPQKDAVRNARASNSALRRTAARSEIGAAD